MAGYYRWLRNKGGGEGFTGKNSRRGRVPIFSRDHHLAAGRGGTPGRKLLSEGVQRKKGCVRGLFRLRNYHRCATLKGKLARRRAERFEKKRIRFTGKRAIFSTSRSSVPEAPLSEESFSVSKIQRGRGVLLSKGQKELTLF